VGSWTEKGVILDVDGMLRELHKNRTDISWETIPDGRSSCTETTSDKWQVTSRDRQILDIIKTEQA